MLKRTEGHCWLSRADAIASAPRALTSRLFHFSCQGYIVNLAFNVLCLFDPQGCAQCHSLSKSRSLWLQRAPLSQGESGQIGRLFCEALGYKIKQHGKGAPKVDVHYKDFFFFDGRDILSIASECCGVVWNTYTQARARTHTHTRARMHTLIHIRQFLMDVLFSVIHGVYEYFKYFYIFFK